MLELRPPRIILISFYCFLVGLFLFSLTANTILGNNGVFDVFLWIPVSAAVIFAFVIVGTGIGILYYNQLSWKILFFALVIFISNVISFIFVSVIFVCLNMTPFLQLYQSVHVAPVTGVCFISIFLLGVIVLYHLTRKDVVIFFGEMGDLVEPFL